MKIYTLSSSLQPNQIRYIGYTKKRLNTRLAEHKSESARRVTHKDKWIQKVIGNGGSVIIKEIDSALTEAEIKEKEVNYIKSFKGLGANLVNGTDGGDGTQGVRITEEHKEWNTLTKSKTIYVFDYETREFLFEATGIAKMCKGKGLTKSKVNDVLRGKNRYYKGMVFCYTKEYREIILKERTVWNKGISTKGKQGFKTTSVVISNGEGEIRFDTTGEAARHLLVTHSLISRASKTGERVKGFFIRRIAKAA